MTSIAQIAYLGPSGTYTEEAALQVAPEAQRLPFATIQDVFAAVESGAVRRGIVPMENVIHGVVTETLDNLYTYADHVRIVDALLLPIQHAIGVLNPGQAVARVLSKDQALKQCALYLSQNFPTALQVECTSTAAAISQVAEAKLADAAAIGSAATLRAHGLHVLSENIGDSKDNKTRFVVLANYQTPFAPPSGNDTTALAIHPHRDRVGLLQGILSIVSRDHGLSCSSIHSRPDTQGAFRFYLEMEGHLHDPAVRTCLQNLEREMHGADCDIRVFGTYPRRLFNQPRLRTLGIVGGTGQMGRWFERFLRDAGYQVLICGRATALSHAECVAQSDAVLVNVPISSTLAVLRQVGALLTPGKLLIDNTSVKTQPVAAMLQSVAPGVEVLGMHTVFGPNVEGLVGQNVIFTRTAASNQLSDEFENIFHKYGARITHTTPEHHDKQMALHQNLEHFSKIVLAQLIRQNFSSAADLDAYASPNSRASLATMGRILSGDPDLYVEIQGSNTQGPALIEAYARLCQEFAVAIASGSMQGLKDSIEKSRQALGQPLIDDLVERSKRMAKAGS